jgi:hypothetical protein
VASNRRVIRLTEAVEPVAEAPEPDGVFVSLADFDDFRGPAGTLRPLREAEAEVGSMRGFREGDILVARSKSGPKVWRAEQHGGCPSSFVVLRPTGLVDPRYLTWYFRLDRVARGLGRAADLDKQELPLPGAGEVQATVELLELLAAMITLRDQALAATQRLGPALFEARFGNPLDDGGSWSRVVLGEILQIESGWSPQCADRAVRDDEWGVIKASAVSTGTFRPEENKALPRDMQPRTALELHPGDLLMVRSNSPELVGVTAIVEDHRPRLILSDKVWRLRVSRPAASPRCATSRRHGCASCRCGFRRQTSSPITCRTYGTSNAPRGNSSRRLGTSCNSCGSCSTSRSWHRSRTHSPMWQ